MLTDKPVLLTKEGFDKLQDELQHLREVRRPEIADRIREAKEFGDLSENAEYTEAKNEQSLIEGRVQTIEAMLRNAEIIEEHDHHSVVEVGSTVTLHQDGMDVTYTVVGPAEADPTAGRISNESPVGKAVMNHKAGQQVTVKVPDGEVKIKIVKVV